MPLPIMLDKGTLIVNADIESCTVALYSVYIHSGKNDAVEYNVLIGKTNSEKILDDDKCKRIFELSVVSYTEEGRKSSHWLKGTSGGFDELDSLVPTDEILSGQKKLNG